MGTVKIINNSTLTDYAAVMRIGRFMAGDEYYSVHDERGNKIVNIEKTNKAYIVTDIE